MFRHIILAFCATLALAMPMAAQTTADSGNTEEGLLLSVTLETGQTVRLDRKTLDSLPQDAFKTSTPWTEGIVEFSGPALKDVLAFAGVKPDRSIAARAINDYQVVFVPHHIEDRVPILATKLNGEPFSQIGRAHV